MVDQVNPSAAEYEWPDLTLSGDEVLIRNLSMYVSTSEESIMWLHWNPCACVSGGLGEKDVWKVIPNLWTSPRNASQQEKLL